MERIMFLNKLSSPFLGHASRLLFLVLLITLIVALVIAKLVGVASGDSHVIADEYIDVEPDGSWTAEVEAGEHQEWSFDLAESRSHRAPYNDIRGL